MTLLFQGFFSPDFCASDFLPVETRYKKQLQLVNRVNCLIWLISKFDEFIAINHNFLFDLNFCHLEFAGSECAVQGNIVSHSSVSLIAICELCMLTL